MQVKLQKSFPVDAPASAAWTLLQDIRSLAACMPGAQITEQVDAKHYAGQVSVKLGPAAASFKGTIEVRGIEPDQRRIRLYGKGTDVKGTSGATMDLTARVQEAGAGKCELVGDSEVTVSGMLANFGGRMMTQVSDQILKQFGANFANRVVARGEGAGAAAAAAKLAEQPRQLNALALLWRAIVGFFKSLLGGRKSGSAG